MAKSEIHFLVSYTGLRGSGTAQTVGEVCWRQWRAKSLHVASDTVRRILSASIHNLNVE